jgi:hypothetical protein
LLAFLLALGLGASACGRRIGDACRVADDCIDTDFDRQCDTSQPGGYCTLANCDERSCPSESACIRFFRASPGPVRCTPGRPPVESECGADELCLDSGVCAPRSSERRFCAKTCDDNGDCRSEYECRTAGANGSQALTRTPGARVRFCAPRAQAASQ